MANPQNKTEFKELIEQKNIYMKSEGNDDLPKDMKLGLVSMNFDCLPFAVPSFLPIKHHLYLVICGNATIKDRNFRIMTDFFYFDVPVLTPKLFTLITGSRIQPIISSIWLLNSYLNIIEYFKVNGHVNTYLQVIIDLFNRDPDDKDTVKKLLAITKMIEQYDQIFKFFSNVPKSDIIGVMEKMKEIPVDKQTLSKFLSWIEGIKQFPEFLTDLKIKDKIYLEDVFLEVQPHIQKFVMESDLLVKNAKTFQIFNDHMHVHNIFLINMYELILEKCLQPSIAQKHWRNLITPNVRVSVDECNPDVNSYISSTNESLRTILKQDLIKLNIAPSYSLIEMKFSKLIEKDYNGLMLFLNYQQK